MKNLTLFFACITVLCIIEVNAGSDLKIDVTRHMECSKKSRKGSTLRIHYIGTFEDGKEFDNSYRRGHPLEFVAGSGTVIKGFDQGLINMCEGEKRRLTIPPELAYGEKGFDGLIPANTTIIFNTELLSIDLKDEL